MAVFSTVFYTSAENPQVILYEKNACTHKTFTMWQLQALDCSEPLKLQGTNHLHLPQSRSHQSHYCERQVVHLDIKGSNQQAHLPSKCDQDLRIHSPVCYLRSMIKKRKPFLHVQCKIVFYWDQPFLVGWVGWVFLCSIGEKMFLVGLEIG